VRSGHWRFEAFNDHADLATLRHRAPFPLAERPANRGVQSLRVFARLAPGVTLASTRAEMAAVMAHLEREFPGTNRNVVITQAAGTPIIVATTRLSIGVATSCSS
jgi:hypothetical protein